MNHHHFFVGPHLSTYLRIHFCSICAQGILDPRKWPVFVSDQIDVEGSEKRRKKIHLGTLPELLGQEKPKTWQEESVDSSLSVQLLELSKLKEKLGDSDPEVTRMSLYDYNSFKMNKKARKALRKLLKSHGVTVDVTPSQASEFVEATKAEVKYRELLKSKYKEIVQSTSESQIDSLSSRIYRRNVLSETEESSREILVVTIPIVQYAGDFHVHEGQGESGG